MNDLLLLTPSAIFLQVLPSFWVSFKFFTKIVLNKFLLTGFLLKETITFKYSDAVSLNAKAEIKLLFIVIKWPPEESFGPKVMTILRKRKTLKYLLIFDIKRFYIHKVLNIICSLSNVILFHVRELINNDSVNSTEVF